MTHTGSLRKMVAALQSPVAYRLPLGEELLPLNALLGKSLMLSYTGAIHCVACGRKTSKSFNQGYCYPCLRRLARCDSCIIKPEQCHFHAGTCREPDWAQTHCMQAHIVYLANSSGVKVGVTRQTHVPTRWIDQGATQALAVFQVKNRYVAGLLEVALKNHVGDKTNWRAMLKGRPERADLATRREALRAECEDEIRELETRFGEGAVRYLAEGQQIEINYPVEHYPDTVRALGFDKTPQITGTLLGIKGQYLILDTGVLNIRKFAGYEVGVTAG